MAQLTWKIAAVAVAVVLGVCAVAIFSSSTLAVVIGFAMLVLAGLGVLGYNQGQQSQQLQNIHVTTNGNQSAQLEQMAAQTRMLAMSPALPPEAVIAAYNPKPAPPVVTP